MSSDQLAAHLQYGGFKWFDERSDGTHTRRRHYFPRHSAYFRTARQIFRDAGRLLSWPRACEWSDLGVPEVPLLSDRIKGRYSAATISRWEIVSRKPSLLEFWVFLGTVFCSTALRRSQACDNSWWPEWLSQRWRSPIAQRLTARATLCTTSSYHLQFPQPPLPQSPRNTHQVNPGLEFPVAEEARFLI